MLSSVLLSVTGGLALFLYAISCLSDTLKMAAEEKVKQFLSRLTKNIFISILLGVIATTLLDSSSAVIIMVIVMVNAEMMDFRKALGIVLGANIGTTVSSQIIALDIGEFSGILIGIGLIASFIFKNEQVITGGRVVMYLGILFFGLYTVEEAVGPLRESPQFKAWMTSLVNPFQGALVGGVVTLVIQSSSATVAIAIALAGKGLVSLPAGIAVMLGAELGTCSDTLLATLRTNRQAVKTGLFHFTFNFFSICLGLLFFDYFVALVTYLSAGASLKTQIANAHVMFNAIGVLLVIPFLPWIASLLERMVPEPKITETQTVEVESGI